MSIITKIVIISLCEWKCNENRLKKMEEEAFSSLVSVKKYF